MPYLHANSEYLVSEINMQLATGSAANSRFNLTKTTDREVVFAAVQHAGAPAFGGAWDAAYCIGLSAEDVGMSSVSISTAAGSIVYNGQTYYYQTVSGNNSYGGLINTAATPILTNPDNVIVMVANGAVLTVAGLEYIMQVTGLLIDDNPPTPPPPAGQFLVQIQRNNSENEHVTKDVDTIEECYGVLREDCSLTDPVILFEYPLTLFVDANYMTIPIFGRSYFIRDVNALSAQLTEVYAHVDVLSSFADEIKANKGIVRRQAKDWNLYLNDDVIRCYQNPIVETRLFPHGFESSSYVLLLAGRRNVGVDTGQGGMISGDGIEGGGAGNVNSKTTSGLVKYAAAQVGKPYWYGTFGNEASADLLAIKRNQYSDMYDISVVGGTPFEDQYGQRVHDCVGLIKGYRWRENATGAEPVYRLAEDVNVQGLYAQCTRKKGTVTDPNGALVPVGAVLFYANMQHCGVHIGAGSVIEARGHRYGVVITSLATRPDFTLWGIPDWLQQV